MIKINTIYNEDCLGDKGLILIPNKSIDMVFCDLPYGTTNCSWDTPIDLPLLWKHYERIVKDNGAIVLTAQSPFDKVLAVSNLKLFKYEWIWEKPHATGYLNSKKMPMKAHENVLIFYKKLPTYNPIKTFDHKRKISTAFHKRDITTTDIYSKHNKHSTYDSTERYPRSVQVFKSDKQKLSLHGTQKPVNMCSYFIKTYSNPGNLILDNCSGSGTTAISCIETNRNYICFENDINIYNKSIDRIIEHPLS